MTETKTGAAEGGDVLDSVNLEASDRRTFSQLVAGTRTEVRALLGANLPDSPDMTHLNRRDIVGRGRGLFRRAVPGYIQEMVERITPHGHPSHRHIIETATQNFNRLHAAYHTQGHTVPHEDHVSDEVILGRAVVDALFDHIKEADLEFLAANVADRIPIVALSDHFRIAAHGHHPARLTAPGLDLLERLRKGNANPAKVILAFAAALDTAHFNPEVASLPLPALAPNERQRLNLRTAVLEAPAEGMNQNVYRMMQRIAQAVEKYESIPDDSLEHDDPPAPTASPRGDAALVKHQERQARYAKARSLVASITRSARNLETYFNTPLPVTGALPDRPPAFTNLAGTIAELEATTPPLVVGTPGPTVPLASEVRDILSGGIGGELSKADEYKERSTRIDQGLIGADACDKILAEYTRRVGGVDDETAKAALASTTGRALASSEALRIQRHEISTVEPDHVERTFPWQREERLRTADFRHKNRDGMRWYDRNFFVGTRRNAFQIFVQRLNDHHIAGLENPDPLSDANSLDAITTRYHTLRYLTHTLPAGDEKHLPMTAALAGEMARLRNAIVKRQLQMIGLVMQRKGIERLKKEDVDKIGLRGTNIESLPYDEIQDKLIEFLDAGNLDDAMKHKVEHRIEHAWAPIARRKKAVKERREWRRKTFGTFVASPIRFGGKVLALPFVLPYKALKYSGKKGKGIFKKLNDWGNKESTFFGGGSSHGGGHGGGGHGGGGGGHGH